MALAPALFVAGLGLGVSVAMMFQTVLASVPPRDTGSASGSLQAFQQVGGGVRGGDHGGNCSSAASPAG